MDATLYSTIWAALALFTVAEAGKRRFSQHPGGAGLGLAGVAIRRRPVHAPHRARVRRPPRLEPRSGCRETARQTAAVYDINWGGGVYVNYFFVATWLIEAWWWRAYPSLYFGRRRAITWALRAFYFLIIVNAVVVFASVPRRALGVVLVGALVWIWRPGPGVDSSALNRITSAAQFNVI